MFCGNREGISGLPCSTLQSVDARCSIALLFILYMTAFLSIAKLFFSNKKETSHDIHSPSGRNGLTRNVATRKPTPMSAWNAMVKGRDLYGPIRYTTKVASAVQ